MLPFYKPGLVAGHGGGTRCRHENCNKFARAGTKGVCLEHAVEEGAKIVENACAQHGQTSVKTEPPVRTTGGHSQTCASVEDSAFSPGPSGLEVLANVVKWEWEHWEGEVGNKC